jgi:DNA repair exonuclease SbcCD ATPase subunit
MNVTLNLNPKEYQDLIKYCEINELTIDDIVKKSYLEGFMIEKYGLLGGAGGTKEVEVIKEVIKYVEVPVVEEKEVPVTNLDNICDNTQENELLLKIQQLESDKQLFSTKLDECNGEVQKFSTKTTEMENIFQNKMSKKEQELDELRQELNKQLDRPPVEKIVEVVVENESTDNSLKPKLDALQTTLAKVRQETLEKDKKIRELEQTIQEIQKLQENKQAIYFNGSNLNNKLNN